MANNFEKRETTSIYEDAGRKFKLGSYDPIEGNYILTQVISFVLPFGIGDALFSSLAEEGSEVKLSEGKRQTNLPKMPKEEFMNLMRDILMTINEVYEGGAESPVVRDNGTYGVADLTMGLVVKLVVASLAFNFRDFFNEVPLAKELMEK